MERRRFLCTICSPAGWDGLESVVAFTAQRNLTAHMRSIHACEIRRFACPFPSCPALLSSKVGSYPAILLLLIGLQKPIYLYT